MAKEASNKPLTRAEALKKVRALGKISRGQRNEIVCALIGHSNILTGCFGYISCARCEAQVGDTLAGSYWNADAVVVGHDCADCRKNAKRLTWRDTLYAPDPFPKKQAA